MTEMNQSSWRERQADLEANGLYDRRDEKGLSFHEKKLKNQKINLGGSYKKNKGLKYKKPRTKGDKIANRKKR